MDLGVEFIVDKENLTVLVKRRFNAKLQDVWDAFSKGEILDQWFGPKPWRARTKKMDFREGGQWLYAMVGPEGQENWGRIDYLEIENLVFIKSSAGFCDSEGLENTGLPRSIWNTRFFAEQGYSRVEILINYENLEHLEWIVKMGFKEGLTMSLNQLYDLF